MPRDASHLRRPLLAAIHMRAKALGLGDVARRALQQRVGGHASCADMTVRQLRAVADELQLAERRLLRPGPVDASRPVERLDGMRRRAQALAAELGAGDAYLDAIGQRQAGVTLADASAEQLRGIIAAVWRQTRRRRKEATHALG